MQRIFWKSKPRNLSAASLKCFTVVRSSTPLCTARIDRSRRSLHLQPLGHGRRRPHLILGDSRQLAARWRLGAGGSVAGPAAAGPGTASGRCRIPLLLLLLVDDAVEDGVDAATTLQLRGPAVEATQLVTDCRQLLLESFQTLGQLIVLAVLHLHLEVQYTHTHTHTHTHTAVISHRCLLSKL